MYVYTPIYYGILWLILIKIIKVNTYDLKRTVKTIQQKVFLFNVWMLKYKLYVDRKER